MEPHSSYHSIFNLDLIYQPDTGVICQTYNQFFALCNLGHTHGLRWASGESFIENPKSHYAKNVIFFMPDGMIANSEFRSSKFTTLQFSQIINKDKLHDRRAKDLLRVLSTTEEALRVLSQFTQIPNITNDIIDDFTSDLLSNWEL